MIDRLTMKRGQVLTNMRHFLGAERCFATKAQKMNDLILQQM